MGEFAGVCPGCGAETDFWVPTLADTAKTMAMGAVQLVTGPAAFFRKQFLRRNAEIGRCPKCNLVVLRCPACGTFVPREYDPRPCPKCGLAYAHP